VIRIGLIRGTALGLLEFTMAVAFYGGWQLLSDPMGGKLGMTTDLLAGTPFRDFFWPGLVLFVTVGLGSLAATAWVMRQWPRYSLAIMGEGCILTAWIAIQYMLIREFHWLQAFFLAVGLLLMGLGAWLWREKDPRV